MRYTYLHHELPSPSDTGLITKGGKTRPSPLILQLQQPQQQQKIQTRLPTSQRHRIRKASISTGGSSFPSVERRPSAAKKLKVMPEKDGVVVEVDSPREMRAASKMGLHKSAASPRLTAWESYLHWLCLTEEPGTLWASSLCATFHECLAPNASCSYPATAAECAARIDDIYWSFYLPLDPLLQFMEDKILSGYLLHVWTMFVELGKRIPHDDPAQDKLVELLKELVHLPPMEVRTWEGNNAPWSDLPTLDDALISGWDDLYDPEIQMTDPERHWVNYFSFIGRLVAADVTPDWWEIPAVTLRDVIAEDVKPNYLTRYKTMALAEFMNKAGDGFLDWTMDSGLLNVDKNKSIIEPLMQSPIAKDWFESRQTKDKE